MSKLSALQGKGKVFNIGGVELELKPLSVDELDMFSVDDKAPMDKQMEMSKNILRAILKKSVPDATEEELKNISVEHLEELMKAVSELHNLSNTDSKLEKIKNVIKARQPKEEAPK